MKSPSSLSLHLIIAIRRKEDEWRRYTPFPSLLEGVEEGEEGEEESCEEVLNSILPPREWEHGGKLWRQRVSASPATR